jgi:hypothetical protein
MKAESTKRNHRCRDSELRHADPQPDNLIEDAAEPGDEEKAEIPLHDGWFCPDCLDIDRVFHQERMQSSITKTRLSGAHLPLSGIAD